MDSPVIRRPSWFALLIVACFGAVLAGYGRVVSPAPLLSVALMLLWAGVFALACVGAGEPVAARAGGVRVLSPAGAVVSFALGAGVLAMAAFALGSVGWLKAPVLAAVVLVAAAAGAVTAARWASAARPKVQARPHLVIAFIAVAATTTLLAASVPSAFYDQLHYHLAFPFQWVRVHRMIAFPQQDYSFLPSNMGMLYTYALALLPTASAQMLHWGMGVASVVGAAVLARMLAPGNGAWWSAALLAATPAVMLTATWAASDLGVTAFGVAAWILAMAAWQETSDSATPRRWLTCGALVGLAVGCKVVAIATVAVPLACATLLAGGGGGLDHRWRRAFARVGWLTLGAAAAFLPWMVRNMVLVGNPVYPLFSTAGVGGARGIVNASVGDLSATPPGVVRWALGRAHALLLGTFTPRGAGGNIGPAYLMLLPAAVWWVASRKRPLARLVAVGLAMSVAAWSLVPQLGRYLLPALVLAAALEGAAWADVRASLGRWVRPLLSGVLAVAMAWGMLGAVSGEVVSRVGCALGAVDRSYWMRESVDYWSAAQFINDDLPANAQVMLVGEARCMYIDRNVVVEDPYQVPFLSQFAEEEGSADSIARRLRQSGVTHLLFNRAEAARIAEMTGRKDFFNLRTQAARDRLRVFFAEDARAVFTDGAVSVLELTGGGP